MSSIAIRQYQSTDKQAVRKICYATSFQGSPEKFGVDEDFSADILTNYYLDLEPQSCFVAVYENEVIGYVFGSVNEKKMKALWRRKVLPYLFWEFIRKGFIFNPAVVGLSLRIFFSFLKGEFRSLDCASVYPALVHINIKHGCQSKGVGRLLMEEFLKYLRVLGVRGVHLTTNSDQAKYFFENNGFQVFHSSRRSYYRYKLGRDISCYLMVKAL
jgi:GNAT superfamily N-acetyltransferase